MQCQFVSMGAELLDAAQSGPQTNVQQVWFGIQSMLMAAANISKLLWGSTGEEGEARQAALRESLEVDNSSPLRSRDLRNDFEHIDDRIRNFYESRAGRAYITRTIGPIDAIGGPKVDQSVRFGNYDPTNAVATFWSNSSSVKEIYDEAMRIL